MEIYVISESDTGEIRYVGKTSKSIEKRLRGHLHASQLRKKTHKNNWIKCVLDRGAQLLVSSLQVVGDLDGDAAEVYWIDFLRSKGCRLVNSASGGQGGSPMKGKRHSEETKRKMSKTAKAIKHKPLSERTKEKLRAAMIDRKIPEQFVAYMGKKGVSRGPMSNESKVKMSLAKKGKPSTRRGCSDAIILGEYQTGLSSKKIAKKHRTCSKRVLSVLKANSIVLRKAGAQPR